MLTAHEVDICVTPGARFPPGARLPPDFPFAWLGTCSRSWGAVGCLVRVELLKAIEPLVDFGCERIFWLKVDGAEGQLVICAIYPAPGGDEQTWKQIIDEFHLVRNRFPRARVYILGDGNVHLASVVDHPASCTCLHCKQSAADTRIDNSIRRAGLVALNDGKPTHQSGTTIDVALAVPTHAVPAKSLLTTVGESDHWPIIITVPFAVIDEERCTLGRVCWSEAEWDDILGSISQMLDCLSDAITPLLAHTVLRPPTLGGCSTKKIRRALLDIAAWCRDVLYALAGHFAGAVKVRAKTRSRQSSALQPTAYESFKDFKAAVQAATWKHQRAAVSKYQDLRSTCPGAADRFLSFFFKPKSDFSVALCCPETGRPLMDPETVEVWMRDIRSRCNYVTIHDPTEADQTSRNVTRIRAAGAHPTALGSPCGLSVSADPLYTDEELTSVLTKLSTSKRCLGMPYAALKAGCQSGKTLTRNLVNFSLFVCLPASRWAIRLATPIRKGGPRIVRRTENLRPISIANDMARMQDALWIQRAASRFETFCGGGQMGGTLDPVTLVLTLILLAQSRHSQGLATYLAFGDLKWAFDLADVPSMKLNCFMAGIVGQAWLLIDDIMDSDTQCIEVHGLMSALFVLTCGTAQGRTFSIQLFNGLLRWLPDEIEKVLAGGARASLPPFARGCLIKAGEHWPPLDLSGVPGNPELLSSLVEGLTMLAHSETTPWPATQHRLVALLSNLPRLADRIALVERLGSCALGPLQYIDDLTAACPSLGALRAVLSNEADSACSRYASKAKAAFNYGPD